MQISEKINELVNLQTTLTSYKESDTHRIYSYENELGQLKEDTRSLKVKLEKKQEENNEFVSKNNKLSSQIELLGKEENQSKLLQKENLRELQSRDNIIDELHRKRQEEKMVIMKLREQATRLFY